MSGQRESLMQSRIEELLLWRSRPASQRGW